MGKGTSLLTPSATAMAEQRIEEASAWLVALQDSDPSADLLQRWEHWVADPENRDAFDQQARLWRQLNFIARPKVPTALDLASDDFDGSTSIAAWKSRRAARDAWLRRRSGIVALAAILAALVLGLIFVWHGLPLSSRGPQLLVYETAVGEHRKLRLPDGSVVTLGGRTSLSVGYSEDRRTVSLNRGEGLFHVTRDAHRPFMVLAGNGAITAVGTEFNVRHNDNRVVVTVTEGVVSVSPRTAPAYHGPDLGRTAEAVREPLMRLERGEEVIYEPRGQVGVVEHVDPRTAAAWRDGLLRYHREPLKHVIADISRYSTRQIVLGDRVAGELLLTGTVFSNRVDEWVRSLEGIFPVRVVETDDEHILIRSRPEHEGQQQKAEHSVSVQGEQ